MDYENNENVLRDLMVDNHTLLEVELRGNGNVEIEVIDLQANETALIGQSFNDLV